MLKQFVAAARHLHFAHAARELGVPRSTVIASVRTPAGSTLGAPVQLRVQSTVYGPVALAINLGVAALVVILALRRVSRRLPGILIAVVLATLLVSVFGLAGQLAVVGAVPHGFASAGIPAVSPADLLHMREGDVPSVAVSRPLRYVGHLKYNPPPTITADGATAR